MGNREPISLHHAVIVAVIKVIMIVSSKIELMRLIRLAPGLFLLQPDVLLPKLIEFSALLLSESPELLKLLMLLYGILNPLVLNADTFFEHCVFPHEPDNELLLL
jgi:hypothetical protein